MSIVNSKVASGPEVHRAAHREGGHASGPSGAAALRAQRHRDQDRQAQQAAFNRALKQASCVSLKAENDEAQDAPSSASPPSSPSATSPASPSPPHRNSKSQPQSQPQSQPNTQPNTQPNSSSHLSLSSMLIPMPAHIPQLRMPDGFHQGETEARGRLPLQPAVDPARLQGPAPAADQWRFDLAGDGLPLHGMTLTRPAPGELQVSIHTSSEPGQGARAEPPVQRLRQRLAAHGATLASVDGPLWAGEGDLSCA